MFFLAQQTTGDEAALVAMIIGILLMSLLVVFAISIAVCFLVYLPYKAVPVEHQRMSPGLVFLLLIPIFGIIWNFFVFLKIPESFQSYFASQGRTDVGDCGRSIGMWYAICGVCALVPCVNYIAGPAALVLFIIFLVKIWGLKAQIIQGGMPPMAGAPPA